MSELLFQHDPNGYLYLASPYTHPDPAVRQWRYEQVEHAMVLLARENIWTFCPIAHSHNACLRYELPHTFDFWNSWNEAMIRTSGGVLVLTLEGWDQSAGILSELKFAASVKKSIQFYGWLHKYEQQ